MNIEYDKQAVALSTHQDSPFSRARIPALMSDAWPSVLAVGLLATTGSASAGGWSTSTTATQVAPGGTFTVTSIYEYDGNCKTRARVRYVSGSCTPPGDTGWNFNGTSGDCSGPGGSASRTYTMSASPTAPCLISGDGTDSTGHYYRNTYTIRATQSINVTVAPPGSALGGTSFPVAATATSGLPVVVSVSGNCTYAAPNVTMTKTTGTCTVTFSRGDNGTGTWVPATDKVYTVNATGLAQTITVTTPAPASAAYNSSFTVAATTNAGRPVAITTGGSCSGSGSGSATITMTSGTGTCSIYYNQASNDPPYSPAAQVTNSTTATKLDQAITFPDQTTASRVFVNNGPFAIAPTATGGGSGIAITYSSLNTGVCTVAGTTVTMKSVGECVLAANQAGNANYNAAPQETQNVTLTKALQTITVTQSAPGTKGNGQSFTVKATASSGLLVSIQGVGSCTGSGTSNNTAVTITMSSAEGICTVVYTQAGDANYEAADPKTEYVSAASTSGCLGEGTYTGLKFSSSGGYIGWACNDGDYVSPGHSISCWPPLYLPWIRPGWSIQPGSGFKGHVLQTKLNPGKTFRLQLAPGETQYYNLINETDKTCIASGNGVYEYSGTRKGSNSSAGYMVAIQDSATMPSGAYCNYSHAQTKWKINNQGSYITLQNAGYPSSSGCMGSDGFGLSRLLLDHGNGNYGNWGDSWVRNAAPSCSDSGARMTCEGYQAPVPNHIRYEFNADNAYTCSGPEVTIKLCANPMPALGAAGSCTVYGGYAMLRPVSSRGSWSGLTAAPATGFTGASSGVKLSHTVAGQSVNLGYSYKSLSLADDTLECYDTHTNRRVSCTAAMTYKTCPPFDAVEKGAAHATNLYTKLAGTAFEFDVVGAGSYTDNLTVDLVDASAHDACDVAAPVLQALGTAAFSSGRKTYTTTYSNAAAKVKVRIKDKDNTCYASTDAFSIRPAYLALTLDPSSGTLKAGDAFTMEATAKTLSGSTTAAYAGTPAVDGRYIYDWTNKSLNETPQASITGAFAAATGGTASGAAFRYSDIGTLTFPAYTDARVKYFGSAVEDVQFTQASGDQGNGDCVVDSFSTELEGGKYGCNIGSSAVTSVRFTPHHYEVEHAFAPACGSFTYLGQQPAAAPTVVIKAMNGAGTQLVRLRSDYPVAWKPGFTVEAMNGDVSVANPATAAPVLMGLTTFDWPSPSPDAANADGIVGGIYQNAASGFVPRPASKVAYESFALKTKINDSDGITITKCNGADQNSDSCVSPTTKLRFGILKIDNAYGSELLPLYVPVTALYWNGTSWEKNAADNCTQIATSGAGANLAIGNYEGELASSDIEISSASPLTLSAGTGSIRVNAPGTGKQGSADIALNLDVPTTTSDASCLTWGTGANAPSATVGADLKYLRGAWCGGSYVKDPHGRINFGTAKSHFLYKRLH